MGNSRAYPEEVPPWPAVMTLGASTSASITIQAGPMTRNQRPIAGERKAPAMDRKLAIGLTPEP
jgi:hypothetical protein